MRCERSIGAYTPCNALMSHIVRKVADNTLLVLVAHYLPIALVDAYYEPLFLRMRWWIICAVNVLSAG